MEDVQQSVVQLIKEQGILASDLKWSLFVGALDSYRHDSVLRPYPPGAEFLNSDGEKDFTELKLAADGVPNMKMVVERRGIVHMTPASWELLKWVLQPNTFTLRSLDVEKKFRTIQEMTGKASYEVKPSFIFEIAYHSTAGQRFKTLSEKYETMFAYHGSRWENFHSIIHNGLHSHMSKNTLYGEGTYLSSDLAVSLPYSPAGRGWTKSLIGTNLSCVAVCTMLDHPDVKCKVEDTKSSVKRSHAPESLGGAVPEKYYVVTNNEVVQIRYLLIFADKTTSRNVPNSSQWQRWIRKNLLCLLLVAYILILLLISLFNSRTFQNVYRRYVRF